MEKTGEQVYTELLRQLASPIEENPIRRGCASVSRQRLSPGLTDARWRGWDLEDLPDAGRQSVHLLDRLADCRIEQKPGADVPRSTLRTLDAH